MVEKTRKRGVRYVQKKKPKKPDSHWVRNTVWIIVAGFTFVLLSYIGYLDYNVREKFEGNRWAIPARVYASPVELYAGYGISAAKFEELLQRLHYRQDARLLSEGSYFRQGQSISLKTRNFAFWDQPQPASLIRLNFSGSTVAGIVDLAESKEVAIVRMETHPNPAEALSDGPNSWPLHRMKELLETLATIDRAVKSTQLIETTI